MTAKNLIAFVAKLDKSIIFHPDFDNAITGIEHCLQKSISFREPVGCMLTGLGGYGKTTICRVIMSKMPREEKIIDNHEKLVIPAFYCAVPSPATVKSVAIALLIQLNDPNPFVGTTAQLTRRVCHLLKQCMTRLVFLDEFHHLYDVLRNSTRVNTAVCNWIKAIVNETQIMFCLVGNTDFPHYLVQDSQLSRRFPKEFRMQPLQPSTQEGVGSIKPFIDSITLRCREILNIDFTCDFSADHTSNQIYIATSGNPAFVMSLLKEAIYITLQHGGTVVTVNDFAMAWESGICSLAGRTKSNPFKMSPGVLASHLRG